MLSTSDDQCAAVNETFALIRVTHITWSPDSRSWKGWAHGCVPGVLKGPRTAAIFNTKLQVCSGKFLFSFQLTGGGSKGGDFINPAWKAHISLLTSHQQGRLDMCCYWAYSYFMTGRKGCGWEELVSSAWCLFMVLVVRCVCVSEHVGACMPEDNSMGPLFSCRHLGSRDQTLATRLCTPVDPSCWP